jgi:hypothetical protein
MKFRYFIVFSMLALSSLSSAQTSDVLKAPYNAAFKGTYTFGIVSVNQYWVQYNMNNQQVGFCNGGGSFPYGYSCSISLGQDVITGTFVADGKGNIAASSTLSYTSDPNSYQCSTKKNAAPDCPYTVPSGIAWSSGTSYAVGDEVDYSGSTYQAVQANSVAPVLITNGSNPQQGNACANGSYVGQGSPVCTWVLLYASATGKNKSGTGTLAGTYSIQANGIGAMIVTPSGAGGSAGFALIVPPQAKGQQIQLLAQPTLGDESTGTGTAILQ